MESALSAIAAASRRYGSDPQYVFGGGGNTSFKDDEHLYIKPSGVSLATIEANEFVKLTRELVRAAFAKTSPSDPDAREAWIKDEMAAAVCPDSTGRPSVETPVHELMPGRFVVHTHSILINGMTCAADGKAVCERLFPDALWVEYVDPGYTLATVLFDRLKTYEDTHGKAAQVVMLQSHGVFVGGDSVEEIDAIYDRLIAAVREEYARTGISETLATSTLDEQWLRREAPALRVRCQNDGRRAVVCSSPYFMPAAGPLTPDHIVYAKSYAFQGGDVNTDALAGFKAQHGYTPVVCAVEGKGTLCIEKNRKSANLARDAALNAALVEQLTHAFGGPRYLDTREREFIENWEVEIYRKALSEGRAQQKRLAGKVVLVTGAAQGFGKGIAEGLAAAGAHIVVADLNKAGAESVVKDLDAGFGSGTATAVEVDIATESSVAALANWVATEFGGIDVLVANAGVLRAGSVKEMTLDDWEFVTRVNYSGYFLCVKHLAPILAAGWEDGSCGWTDIIQVNSKSGLMGSNRNGAYAGSKFGAIGLTQSFALELVEDHVKVNAVCPGNFFDGPLWSDPERGLFVQYLKAGKVPGAQTVDDVRRSYEAKVPMGRGCMPADVVTAIMYLVDQDYETGQALTITGGQVMR